MSKLTVRNRKADGKPYETSMILTEIFPSNFDFFEQFFLKKKKQRKLMLRKINKTCK